MIHVDSLPYSSAVPYKLDYILDVAALRVGIPWTFHFAVFSTFFLHDVFPFFWLQAHKQFRYAARFIFTLTAAEQLQTRVMDAAYPHLATFAPYE